MKKAKHASQLSVENGQNSSSRTIIDWKDRWVKVRVTMDSGVAGHVMLEGMFPCVKLQRKAAPKKFVAGNGEQIRDVGEKTIPIRQMRESRDA